MLKIKLTLHPNNPSIGLFLTELLEISIKRGEVQTKYSKITSEVLRNTSSKL